MYEYESVLVVAGVGVLLLAALYIRVVPEGKCAVTEYLGHYHRVLHPGVHVLGLFERFHEWRWSKWTSRQNDGRLVGYHLVPTTQQILDVPPVQVVIKDNIQISLDPIIYFNIEDAKQAAYAGSDMHTAIHQLVLTALVQEVASMSLEQVYSSRLALTQALAPHLEQKRKEWGIRMSVAMQNVKAPEVVLKAAEKSIAARQESEAETAREKSRYSMEMTRMDTDSKVALAKMELKQKQLQLQADGKIRRYKMMKDVGMTDDFILSNRQVEAWNTMSRNMHKGTMFMPMEFPPRIMRRGTRQDVHVVE